MVARSRIQARLDDHVAHLVQCRRCPRMQSTPVSDGAVLSDVMLIGQAPGPREPVLQRPFAHTAGKTLFRWFEEFCGLSESTVRSTIYFAAVCRCFPGKTSGGGDRVPAPDEIRNCSSWMNNEIKILRPQLIIPVGRLAIAQFIDCTKLEEVIGHKFRVQRAQHRSHCASSRDSRVTSRKAARTKNTKVTTFKIGCVSSRPLWTSCELL